MLGESYDARQEMPRLGPAGPGRQPLGGGHRPRRGRPGVGRPGDAAGPRRLGELKPKSISEPKPGRWTFDLGQNMVGVVRLKVSAPAGTKVTLRHAEMLNPDGTIYTANLRSAASRRHLHLPRAAAPRSGSRVHLPRLPLRRAHRSARASRRWTPSPASCSAPTRRGPASSPAPIRASTSSSPTSAGASGATTSASPPTARNATSGWAGWATPRSSSARPPTTPTWRRSSPSGWWTWTTASRPTAPLAT